MSDRHRLRSARLLSAAVLALLLLGEYGAILRIHPAGAARDAVLARARSHRPQVAPLPIHPFGDAQPAIRPDALPLSVELPVPEAQPAALLRSLAPDHRPDYPRPPPTAA